MGSENKKIGYRSIADCVVDYFKNKIRKGELRPGDKINEKELCRDLGISRTPIREALIQLEKEGFVEIFPRREIRVRKLSLEEVRDIYRVIGTLEAEAAEIVIDKLKDDDILKMEELYQKMVKAIEENDVGKYIDCNCEIHNIHVSLYENKILSDIISNLKMKLEFPTRSIMNIPSPEWTKELLKDHLDLIQFFKKREKTKARKLMKQHWSFERYQPYINKYYELETITKK